MRSGMITTAALLLGLMAGTPSVRADAALERIFDSEQMKTVNTGQRINFTHTRIGIDPEKMPPLADRVIQVAVTEDSAVGRQLSVSLTEDGRSRNLDAFSGDSGNPVLMIFLESVTKSVAKASGGSPFYIKNRITDAFRRGTELAKTEIEIGDKTIEATRSSYSPFALEQNKARLGDFANFEISFVTSKDVPGRIVEMVALSDPEHKEGYREKITFVGADEVKQ